MESRTGSSRGPRSQAIDPAHVAWLLFGGLIAARIAVSVAMIDRPGLQYDETLFINAATLRIPGLISQSVDGIALMVFPYIGALKSWLYAPLFSIFGQSAATIRVPVVLITTGGLALSYFAVRDLVNRTVAMLAFVALCFDQSVFWLTRNDVGPSAIAFFLKCAALWCMARFALNRSQRWVWLLLATLALGVFNKLDFIWVVNAAAALSAMLMFRYRSLLRTHWQILAIWICGLAVIYAASGAYYFGDNVGSTVTNGNVIGQPWTEFQAGMQSVLSGTWFYGYALAPIGSANAVVLLVFALFLAGGLASVALPVRRNLAVFGLALATVLIALQNLLTGSATSGWHYIAIYPFVTIVAAYGAYFLAHTLFRRSLAMSVALVCVGALALVYDGVLLGKYFNNLSTKEPGNTGWTPAIYRLSSALQQTHAAIFTADWGIYNPLFALHPSRSYDEIAFLVESRTQANVISVRNLLSRVQGPKLVVTHAADKLVFPEASRNLFASVGQHLRPAFTVNGRDSKPVFVVYSYH